MKLTEYTINDIHYVRTHEPDGDLLAFKKNLIVELRENYKIRFSDMGDLLGESHKALKNMYYHIKNDTTSTN